LPWGRPGADQPGADRQRAMARPDPGAGPARPRGVLTNGQFLLLWSSQVATQVGGNMVLYGLTVLVFEASHSNAAVSLLLLTFLLPAALLSAWAGVYVDRFDRRTILTATNLFRGLAFLVILAGDGNLLVIYLANLVVSTLTVFFAPAEAAMIPRLVRREDLVTANGLFTLTMNGAFALGFALLGPLIVTLAGSEVLLAAVAGLYLVAAVFCAVLPPSPPGQGGPTSPLALVADAERAVESTIAQLGEGIAFIRHHPAVRWSLAYLVLTASLIGVLGVLGPDFASRALGLGTKDFVVVVVPLGAGIGMGILFLNSYGRLFPRRRIIEGGLVALGILIAILAAAGPIGRLLRSVGEGGGPLDVPGLVSLLSVVLVIAFLAGASYALVAIPAQTQLHEDLPPDVRGRVFGILNMLVSVASVLPIIVVGPLSDLVGTPVVIFAVAVLVETAGLLSIGARRDGTASASPAPTPAAAIDPMTAALRAELEITPPARPGANGGRSRTADPPSMGPSASGDGMVARDRDGRGAVGVPPPRSDGADDPTRGEE
jgi:MFS family permease